ncbi:pyrimidine reductase family protein [Pseudarthrobacter sp. P1]|uniref:pyrimidine reductase family protein n=1 Tax=Pseudarthrobacter sp. P1 TaxID=3418418 RepID=UPI003CECD6AD
MSGEPIERIFPAASGEASDADLLDWYAAPSVDGGSGPASGDGSGTWVGFNFVSSVDGAATVAGRSGGLGNAADQRIFLLLRRLADVLLVGASTIRVEGYAGPLLDTAAQEWRVAHGKSAHPGIAVVSGSLDLDPDIDFFRLAPVRPVVLTTASAPQARRAALATVADVVDAGETTLDVDSAIAALAERGWLRIHSEGGPHVLGTFAAAHRVDELCLTLSAKLAAGGAGRIAAGPPLEVPAEMELAHVLRSGSMLFLRYVRGENRVRP